jgi:ATP-dependent helicase/nuclease subunit B
MRLWSGTAKRELDAWGIVVKCPLHAPFIPTVTSAILKGMLWNGGVPPEQGDLPGLVLYVPSAGTATAFRHAFLDLSPSGASFLPRILVLGDTGPLDLFAAYARFMPSPEASLELLQQALAIAPAFGDFERQLHLMHLVIGASALQREHKSPREPLFGGLAPSSAFAAGGQIASLISEAHGEGLELSRMAIMQNAYAPAGTQRSLGIFREVLRGWQALKAKAGKLDREERRNRLMAVEAKFIKQSTARVIIAGSTGSIAATAVLMEAVLSLPRSAIVLHGLDDAPAGEVPAPGYPEHHRHGLRQLLKALGVNPDGIPSLDGAPRASLRRGAYSAIRANADESDRDVEPIMRRVRFLSEALLPAPATAGWASYIEAAKNEGGNPAPGLSLVEAANIHEEAAAIALMLRESLETKDQIAAAVTPNESLLGRVWHALAKWGLTAGTHPPALIDGGDRLALTAIRAAASGEPDDFAELMRVPEAAALSRLRRAGELTDLGALRQLWRPRSIADIPEALSRTQHAGGSKEARHPALKRIAPAEWEDARALVEKQIEALFPLTSKTEMSLPLSGWIAAHRSAFSKLSALAITEAHADSPVLRRLGGAEAPAAKISLRDYAGVFEQAAISLRMDRFPLRPHPRLILAKPLDMRLLTADFIILSSLNEGSWPRTPRSDSWLGRGGRALAGLPPLERETGQSAHDFMALASSASRVVLTRAEKENGNAMRTSRWLLRIKALASGIGKPETLKPELPWLSYAAPDNSASAPPRPAPPRPRPPMRARPRRLSVTAIETWLANPYAIYARHILGLEPLRGQYEGAGPRERGVLYHAALHGFFQAHPLKLPANPSGALLEQLDKAAAALGFRLENAPFLRPRFARFAQWFAATESDRRCGVQVLKSEIGAKLRLEAPAGPFEITARADRIDLLSDGTLRIYDFKTSAAAAKTSAARGAPQLALEGLLAREGAFAGLPAKAPSDMLYIVAAGGHPPGELVELRGPAAEIIDAAYGGVISQIARFDNEATPYSYHSRALFRDKAAHDPYAHLARAEEWLANAGTAEGADD